MMNSDLRRTKIVCTIGPPSWDAEMLTRMADYGMDVARLNFSHGDHASHKKVIDRINAYNARHEKQVAIMMDTNGIEIRTGDVQDPITVSKGEEVVFCTHTPFGEVRTVINVNYDRFSKDVVETNRILIDNGELSFDIVRIENGGLVIARARENGKIGTRRHINLPGANIDLPSVTEKDWKDIEFGISENLDFVALSFIRSADEVNIVRGALEKKGSSMKIISKIETEQGVKNIGEIVQASDAIMVARGDLGAEVPFERLPVIQDEIVTRCRDVGKPVIVATHMLESMILHPMPTRAEVTDCAYAVTIGTDCTMLSGETASGERPFECLETMDKIVRATESHLARFHREQETRFGDKEQEELDAAITLAIQEEVDAFVVITESGRTVRNISKFRPSIPIIALTKDRQIQRSLQLTYGIYPLHVPFDASDDKTMHLGLELALREGILRKGQRVIALKNKAHQPVITSV